MNTPTPETDAILEYLKYQFLATDGHIPLREKISKLEQERDEARAQRDHPRSMGITLLDAKWLDPECHNGCKSLVLKHRLDEARKLITLLE